jgi:tRNA (cytidine/uridine-2'-O-)-methyltransferase
LSFHIILHEPEIPQNTGSIGRLCVSNDTKLHLIHPLGFEVSDYYLRRAGLDYWERLAPTHYDDWADFRARNPTMPLRLFSTKAERTHTQVAWADGDGLVFGRETRGLPDDLLEAHASDLVKIPMVGEFHRSLNVAQAAAIGLYEALRQTRGW